MRAYVMMSFHIMSCHVIVRPPDAQMDALYYIISYSCIRQSIVSSLKITSTAGTLPTRPCKCAALVDSAPTKTLVCGHIIRCLVHSHLP